MTRLLRIVFAFLLLAPAVAFTAGHSALAQDAAQSDEGSLSSVDHELQQALDAAGLLDEWLDAGSVGFEAGLVHIDASNEYVAQRDLLLDDLSRLAERGAQLDQRSAQADRLLNDLDALQELTSELQNEVETNGRSAAVSLAPAMVGEARRTLDGVRNDQHQLGLSLDPLALAGHGLTQTSARVEQQIDLLEEAGGSAAPADNTSYDAAIDGFADATTDLVRIRSLIDATVQRSLAAQFTYHAERTAAIDAMPALHDMRHLSASHVGGLSVVTLDAYIRGAAAVDASCPVDWTLLAGIGRVESRHGTIDDTTVQRSGQVSKPILGPLLDGGATEREAAEAAAAEIAAAEAAEAERLAELEAQAAAEAAELAALAALVWGEDEAERRAEELAEQEAGVPAVGLAATPEPVVEEPAPRFDPQLWGEDLPFEEEELPPLEDDGEPAFDESEAEFKGNGFAVIEDSDNGRLDGNSSWDRAVGPMQFIPETWSYWATDGNGDGNADPQNLYDAAASAGQFLCHLSNARGASPSRFVLGYNSSQTYVRNVLAVADTFAAHDLPTTD